MKKSLVLGFGIVLMGSVFAFKSEAVSRLYSNTRSECVYENGKLYCEKAKPRAIRAFSNRVGPYRYRQPSRSKLKYVNYDFSHPTNRHDVWYYSPYRKSTISYSKQKELNHFLHPDLFPRSQNVTQSKINVIRGNRYKVVSSFIIPAKKPVYNFNANYRWSLPKYFGGSRVRGYRPIRSIIINQ